MRVAGQGSPARWRAASAIALWLALLGGCASIPEDPGTPISPVAKKEAHVPFQGAPPARQPDKAAVTALNAKPLDATRLPPFDGEKQEVKEPLRGLPKIDLTVQPDDLWERIRAGFSMPNLEGPLVQDRTAWYAARPEYLKRTFERSRRYLYHIVEELEKRGMPTELALLPMVESSYNPMAYSRAHASGLWQFIPGTGKRYDLAQNWWYDGRRDIVASTSAALDYLKDIYEMNGDWHLALASYNWGENAVAKAMERNRAAGLPIDYSSLRMPEETRYYVPKLQALKNIIANPAPFGIVLDPIPNQPYFATVSRERDMDIRLAAKLAEMPVDEFIALNPAFNRPIIPASVNARIVLPADRVQIFHANLEQYDNKTLVSWKTYQPKAGEKLDAIAKRFGVQVAQLREVNGITPRTRGIPAILVVPVNGAAGDAGSRLPLMYAPPIPVAATRTLVHTVKPGETLISIAGRYKVTPDDLRRWNPVGRLTVGQQLRIQSAASAPTPHRTSGRAHKTFPIKWKKPAPQVKKKVVKGRH
ncbi:MAG: transglycosylase SLT domain-containing protein [Proteobacteria bacterium]|nr:transglycosylase SLT domain-containing protein [Pseudomonadota bacterium]